MVVGAVGNTVYAIGGATKPAHAESTALAVAPQLAPRTMQWAPTWRSSTVAPIARQQAPVITAAGTIWVVGGLDNAGEIGSSRGTIQPSRHGRPDPTFQCRSITRWRYDYRGELVVRGGWIPDGPNLTARTSDRVLAPRD